MFAYFANTLRVCSHSCVFAESRHFSRFPIDSGTIFLESTLSFAFTNLKPFRAGHVLIASKRVEPLWENLSTGEQNDLVLLTQKAALLINNYYQLKTIGSDIVLQDGKDAGQTVPHVHFHICPHESKHAAEKPKDDTFPRRARLIEEQRAEAEEYRNFIFQQKSENRL